METEPTRDERLDNLYRLCAKWAMSSTVNLTLEQTQEVYFEVYDQLMQE